MTEFFGTAFRLVVAASLLCPPLGWVSIASAQQSKPAAPAAVPAAKGSAPAKAKPAAPSAAGKAAPAADTALRAAVTAFMEKELAGKYSESYNLVAADSKDYYLQLPKTKASNFKIESVKIEPGGRVATVLVSSTQAMRVTTIAEPIVVPITMSQDWKMEKGRWVWYHRPEGDKILTGVGFVDKPADAGNAASLENMKQKLPKDTSAEAVAAAGKQVHSATDVDKKELFFEPGKPGKKDLIFHNGNPGDVQIIAEVQYRPKGFKIGPRESYVHPGENLKITVEYEPGDGVPEQVLVRLHMEPFRSVIDIPVILGAEGGVRGGVPRAF